MRATHAVTILRNEEFGVWSIRLNQVAPKFVPATVAMISAKSLPIGNLPPRAQVDHHRGETIVKSITKIVITTLLVGSSTWVSAAQAGTSGPNSTDAKIQALEAEIQSLSNQVQDLKRSTIDQKDQYAEVQKRQAEIQRRQTSAVNVSIDNGRPTIASADGNFTASIRALSQLDWGYYSQSAAAATLPTAYGPDLSSGANFRRVYLGIQGKLFGTWSYNFNYDFGGSGGTETPGHIQSVYLEYDGLGPLAFRIGAFPPPANIEDGTSAGDTIFLERNAPSDLQRNIAGGDGRDAVTILYTGDSVFGAASFTGNKI